jgi:hypothetical protein
VTAKSTNLLTRALANNELGKFLIGEGEYFYNAPNDNDEPQNIRAAFDLAVAPYWSRTKDALLPSRLFGALEVLLTSHPDKNRAIYVTYGWIWYYAYCLAKRRARPDGTYSDLFEVDLRTLASVLKAETELSKKSLAQDVRWAGAGWNSVDGLWAPVVRTARVIAKLTGLDVVPSNA